MKLIITGGHLSPALAVIDALPQGTEVLFVGRKYTFEGDEALSLEYTTITSLGISFKTLTTGRLQRKFTKHTLPSLVKFPYGIFEALRLLRSFHPDIVLTFGGYLSLPIALAARILGIPIVIHEQTLGAGLANKYIARFADTVCISWEQSRKYFKSKNIVLTGNPLRQEFLKESHMYKISAFTTPIIYITGGSAGSHAINQVIEENLPNLLERYHIVHQTGDSREFEDYERLSKYKETLEKKLKDRYVLMKFVKPTEVAGILKNSDIAISRSGINTVTELLYFAKPSILIPLPHGQQNEQFKNAVFLKDLGLSEVILQNYLTPTLLLNILEKMIASLKIYQANGFKAQHLIHTDAAQKIVEVVTYASYKKDITKN